MFILYINDLPNYVPAKIRLYADDCVLYNVINSNDDHNLLNDCFAQFCRWCDTWQMNINFTKTVALSFCKRSSVSLFDYSFNGYSLSRVSEYKYLGLIFTPNMSWSKHIEYTCNKALKKLGYLNRTLKDAPRETKLLTYKSLIRPILEYACPVWNPHKKSDISTLESVQKKAIRFIFRRYDWNFSPSSQLATLGLQTLSERRDLECLKLLHILVNTPRYALTNEYLSPDKLKPTRNSHKLNLTPFHPRTNLFKFSFFPHTIEIWNALPGSTRSLPLEDFLHECINSRFV